MSKTYLRYEPSSSFGVIASSNCNVCFLKASKHNEKPLICSASVREILFWNVTSGELDFKLAPEKDETGDEIVSLAVSKQQDALQQNTTLHNSLFVSAGLDNGTVKIWNVGEKMLYASLSGHRRAVTTLCFSDDGTRLCSGSKDTDIIMWDVVAQQGLFRLKGHKDQVTALCFIGDKNQQLLSSSKDTLVKLWDMETQHCIRTVVGHRNSVWTMAYNPTQQRVVTGSSDHLIRAIDLGTEISETLSLMEGSVARQSNERVETLQFNSDCTLLGCQAAGKVVEVYRVRDATQSQKKVKRRLKRLREKKPTEEQLATAAKMHVTDTLELYCIVRSKSPIASFTFGNSNNPDAAQLILSLKTNAIEVYSLTGATSKKRKTPEAGPIQETKSVLHRQQVLEVQGHRRDVRCVVFSSDDELLVTAGEGSVKLWSVKSQVCLRTVACGYALCCKFVPGDGHVLVGTKTGELVLIKLSNGSILSTTQCHEGALWSIDLRKDGLGFATGGADKVVKFFDFDLVETETQGGEGATSSELTVVHCRTLKLSEDVLSIAYSHHKKASDKSKMSIAVALLDCTVKVFFEDSLKFALSLYGHKLPVLSMDISTDSTLLITGSADKNVKVWGLDFGDCHKSFFAHDASVMCVKFVPNTHYFFSAGKDGRLRYWDADKFEMILSIDTHVGPIWSIAVSSTGALLSSSGHDKSLRIYERTNDIVFIEEEQEKELEKIFDKKLDNGGNSVGSLAVPAIQAEIKNKGGIAVESGVASRRTGDNVRAGERLMDAIDLAFEEHERFQADPKAKPNLLLLGKNPIEYMVHALNSIKPNDIDEALLVQPFDYARRLLLLLLLVFQDESHGSFSIELAVKCTVTLVKIHFKQIVATQSLNKTIIALKGHVRERLYKYQEVVGVNMAKLEFLKNEIQASMTKRL